MSPISNSRTMVIGSRGSSLALWQANWVRQRLAALGCEARIEIIKTTGDKLPEAPLAASGTKGVFIKEIEEALLEGRVDLAVHSMKDLPVEQPEGLLIAAVPEREDARDVLISKNWSKLSDLPRGARLGTGSLRRSSQIRALRPDLEIVPVRGNVDTRLKKLDRGDYQAIVLAAAGLLRLGFGERIGQRFSESEMCPAVGQGALAIEAHRNSRDALSIAGALNHEATQLAVRAERTVLRALGGGCKLPLAAHARVEDDKLHLRGVVASPDGLHVIRAESSGPFENPEALGSSVAEDLIRQGAHALLAAV